MIRHDAKIFAENQYYDVAYVDDHVISHLPNLRYSTIKEAIYIHVEGIHCTSGNDAVYF